MRCKCCDVILPILGKDTELCYKCLSVVHDTLYNNESTVYDIRCSKLILSESSTKEDIEELENGFRNR